MVELSARKRYLLIGLSVGLLLFAWYVQGFATREALRFIGRNQLDKLAHLGGGLFIAIIADWRLRRFLGAPLTFFAYVALITVGWEVFEFLVDINTQAFFREFPKLWFLDSLGDIIAAFFAAYVYRTRYATKPWEEYPAPQ